MPVRTSQARGQLRVRSIPEGGPMAAEAGIAIVLRNFYSANRNVDDRVVLVVAHHQNRSQVVALCYHPPGVGQRHTRSRNRQPEDLITPS